MESIEIKGLDKLNRLLMNAGSNGTQALAKGLYEEATMAFNESQVLVPVDTGALKGSGHVTPPVITKDSVEVTVGYGGPASSYALIVHERIMAPSGKKVFHAPPTQAKYLETPVKRRISGLASRLGTHLKSVMKG
jgi:hypothetical protein